jgi:hypothetical protein
MNVPSYQEAMDTEVIRDCCGAFIYKVAVGHDESIDDKKVADDEI